MDPDREWTHKDAHCQAIPIPRANEMQLQASPSARVERLREWTPAQKNISIVKEMHGSFYLSANEAATIVVTNKYCHRSCCVGVGEIGTIHTNKRTQTQRHKQIKGTTGTKMEKVLIYLFNLFVLCWIVFDLTPKSNLPLGAYTRKATTHQCRLERRIRSVWASVECRSSCGDVGGVVGACVACVVGDSVGHCVVGASLGASVIVDSVGGCVDGASVGVFIVGAGVGDSSVCDCVVDWVDGHLQGECAVGDGCLAPAS